MDFSHNNHKLISQHISSYITDKPLAEMGWTMIKKAFQGHNIATFLIKESEKIVFHRFDLIATGHPQNVAALKAYFNNGYYGVTLTDYYSKPRIFLLKRTSSQLRYQNVITECLLTDIGSDHFLNKNMLIRILKKNDKYYGQFAKALEE